MVDPFNDPFNVTTVEYDEERDFLIINLDSVVKNQTFVELSMSFIANVPPNDSLRGLYSETYYDPSTDEMK